MKDAALLKAVLKAHPTVQTMLLSQLQLSNLDSAGDGALLASNLLTKSDSRHLIKGKTDSITSKQLKTFDSK